MMSRALHNNVHDVVVNRATRLKSLNTSRTRVHSGAMSDSAERGYGIFSSDWSLFMVSEGGQSGGGYKGLIEVE